MVITEKTRLLMVCHMINITGQILPIRKICDRAHKKGVEVMVDGAHTLAHIQFSINDLDCDYYGARVHGCRITPNVFTTPGELDVFVMALKELGG